MEVYIEMKIEFRKWSILAEIWRFAFEIGWFWGEYIRLISISLVDIAGKDCITILNIQIIKFSISIQYSNL